MKSSAIEVAGLGTSLRHRENNAPIRGKRRCPAIGDRQNYMGGSGDARRDRDPGTIGIVEDDARRRFAKAGWSRRNAALCGGATSADRHETSGEHRAGWDARAGFGIEEPLER